MGAQAGERIVPSQAHVSTAGRAEAVAGAEAAAQVELEVEEALEAALLSRSSSVSLGS